VKASPGLLLAAGLALAAVSGGLGAAALGTTSADPSRTVTIEVGTGATGPQGPAGPPGPEGPPGPGGVGNCPQGSTFGEAVFVQQGKGPTTLLTCIKD